MPKRRLTPREQDNEEYFAGLVMPGTNYGGPFNPTDDEFVAAHPPRSSADAAFLKHDRSSSYSDWRGYVMHNKADQELLDELEGESGWHARLGRTWFKVKKRLAMQHPDVQAGVKRPADERVYRSSPPARRRLFPPDLEAIPEEDEAMVDESGDSNRGVSGAGEPARVAAPVGSVSRGRSSVRPYFASRSTGLPSSMYKRARSVAAPVASTSSVNFQAANRRVTLSGREYVTTLFATMPVVAGVLAPSSFSSTVGLLRPTDYNLFSWFAGIAKKFEEFKFHSVQFVYEPQCPTSTSGSIGLWYDGDPTHVQPSNWNNVINTGANTHGAPWAKHVLSVPAHLFSSRKSYYTKDEYGDANLQANGQTQKATDPMEYYPGIYGFASVDVSSGVTIGDKPVTVPLGKVYLDYSVTVRTQNVDGYAKTSLTALKQLSSETADNSGTGMIVKGTATTGWPTTGQAFFGGNNGGTIPGYVQAGSQYFQVTPSNGNLVAVQNLELMLGIRVVAGANVTNITIRVVRGGHNYDCVITANSVKVYVDTVDQSTSPSLVPPFSSSISGAYVLPVALASTSVGADIPISLQVGDVFGILQTGGTLSAWRVLLTPCVFGLID